MKPQEQAADRVGIAQAHMKPAGSPLQTMRAVAWSFFGVRRSVDLAGDVQKLKPVHVVVAGVLGAAVFVLFLLFVVKVVLGSGIAA